MRVLAHIRVVLLYVAKNGEAAAEGPHLAAAPGPASKIYHCAAVCLFHPSNRCRYGRRAATVTGTPHYRYDRSPVFAPTACGALRKEHGPLAKMCRVVMARSPNHKEVAAPDRQAAQAEQLRPEQCITATSSKGTTATGSKGKRKLGQLAQRLEELGTTCSCVHY